MPGPIASSRPPSGGLRRFAPGAAIALVALLAGLSLGTSWLVARYLGDSALTASRLYSVVFEALNNPEPDAASSALLDLGAQVRELGIPLIVTDSAGQVTAAANLAFEALPGDPRFEAAVSALDAINPPFETPGLGAVHYGSLPASGLLRTLAILQALTLVVMVAVAVVAYRNATGAQRDRLWVAMAREAAHQMGTPLTSLQGWIEQLRSEGLPPQKLADFLDADAERLHRVAQRFERIGNPARRDPVALGALAERVAGYFRPRLPRHANRIGLEVLAPSAGPVILGDPVLLEWALEAMVKNAIDALQGRGGKIVLAVRTEGSDAILRVVDNGPGVPRELRRTLFEPGISSKRGGWGIGLALARRVVADGHDGTLMLEPSDKGTTFVMRLPLAEPTA